MRRILASFAVIGLIALGAGFAGDRAPDAAPAPARAAENGRPPDARTCLDQATYESMSEADLEAWGREHGVFEAQSGGTGCPSTERCSDTANCSVTNTCFGPFDSGEDECPVPGGGPFTLQCPEGQTVHYDRCTCAGQGCPLFEASNFHCA